MTQKTISDYWLILDDMSYKKQSRTHRAVRTDEIAKIPCVPPF